MAGAFEQTMIIGNVGRSDDLRATQSGTSVHSFSVAVSTRWTDSNGDAKEKTNWYRVTCWRGLAEVTAKYVTTGMSVMVVGTAEAKAYLGQDGEARATLELTARDVQFLSRSGDENGASEYDTQDDEQIPF